MAACRVAPALIAIDPTFQDVSIWDVSARKPGFIAVAAVYTRAGAPNVGVLLYFGWDGKLMLWKETPDIRSLEIDEADHVWALNDFDPDNRSEFVFTEFNSTGFVIKGVVEAQGGWSTNEGTQEGGQTSFGISPGEVWAWLPHTRTFVVADRRTAAATTYQPGLPDVPQSFERLARRAERLPDGQLLMDVSWRVAGKPQLDSAWFVWSPNSNWTKLPHPVSDRNGFLYGIDRGQVISVSFAGLSPTFWSAPVSKLLNPRSEPQKHP